MAFSYNHVTLVGRVCADPVYKDISARLKKLSFNIAINRRFKTDNKDNKSEADFLSVCMYGMPADVGKRILVKGMPLLVWGKIQVRTYKKDKKTIWITEIVADNFQVLEKLSIRLQQEYNVGNNVPEDLNLDLREKVMEQLNEATSKKKTKKV